MYHFDFYRLRNSSEWLETGFREYFNSQSMCLVEWPERAEGLLALPDLELRLEFADEARRATIESRTPSGAAWLSTLRFSS